MEESMMKKGFMKMASDDGKVKWVRE